MELFLGFYFGCMLMVILYNLHWYVITKEKSSIYYVGLRVSLTILVMQSILTTPLGEFYQALNRNVVFLFVLIFSKEFLGLRKNFHRLNTFVNYVIIFILSCFAYSAITGNYEIFDNPYSIMTFPLILLGCFVYSKGYDPAKYYVVAWGIAIVLLVISDLNEYRGLDFHPETPFSLIGQLIGSVILSYAISVKTGLIVREKEEQEKFMIHQAQLASMGQMLENISHQWGQPLNRIAAYIINLQMHIKENHNNNEYAMDALEQSQLQLEYMSNTMEDFTNFNKKHKNKNNFLVSDVVADVCKIVGPTLKKNGIVFEIIERSNFSVYSYQNELSQVVLNLVQNAQDALLKRQVRQAEVTLVIEKNYIRVQDNAGGIEPSAIDYIFDPYFTTKTQSSSLGLGLYMSKLILDKHFNASIEVVQNTDYTSFNIVFEE